MVKRLFNLTAREMLSLNRDELKQSIKACEGRVIMSENIVTCEPPVYDITSSEVAKAFGADLILLNMFDVQNPKIKNLECNGNIIGRLKELVGRPIGLNLEPVDENAGMLSEKIEIPEGRKATRENLKRASDMGFDFVVLTGNPATGVSNREILSAVSLAREYFAGLIIAGKMHGAGVDEDVIDLNSIKEFITAGADVILLPAIGTVPGVTKNLIVEAVQLIRTMGALSMSAIGTSQESSPPEVIRDIAIRNKIAGVDIQHIGDSGYGGVATFTNILELSRTIRGDRHTIKMIASSINR